VRFRFSLVLCLFIAAGVSCDEDPVEPLPQPGGLSWEVLSTWPALTDIVRTRHGEAYAIGWGGVVMRYMAGEWSYLTQPSKRLGSLWGDSEQDLFAVGTVVKSGAPGPLFALWGSSGGDMYAVGPRNVALHFDGSDWTSMPSGTGQSLFGVWGSSEQDIYAAGVGVVVHFDGADWTKTHEGSGTYLAVWGSGPDDVYVAGNAYEGDFGRGRLIRYDGSIWSVIELPELATILTSVWGSGADDVWVGGINGELFHYDGRGWSFIRSGTAESINDIAGASKEAVFAVGSRGTVLSRTASR